VVASFVRPLHVLASMSSVMSAGSGHFILLIYINIFLFIEFD
jgi:hypothetical protein